MQMKTFQTITEVISLPITVFPFEFNLPQIERNLISNIINFVYKLRYELPNDLRFRDHRKLENEKEISKLDEGTG